jgi:hypothetical protein
MSDKSTLFFVVVVVGKTNFIVFATRHNITLITEI